MCTRARTSCSMSWKESSFLSSMENGTRCAQAIRCTSAAVSSTRTRTSPPRTLGFSSRRRPVSSATSSSSCRPRRLSAPCPLLIYSTLSQRGTASRRSGHRCSSESFYTLLADVAAGGASLPTLAVRFLRKRAHACGVYPAVVEVEQRAHGDRVPYLLV